MSQWDDASMIKTKSPFRFQLIISPVFHNVRLKGAFATEGYTVSNYQLKDIGALKC